jgi:2-iminoacetate synthase
MNDFKLDEGELRTRLRLARENAPAVADAALERARLGGGLDADEITALWLAPGVSTEVLYQLARELRARLGAPLETFSPLYMTNTCDAECLMCGMRRDNAALRRETANLEQVEEQLQLLQQRGMNAVSLLTGEYRPERRPWALRYVNQALRLAQAMGFGHVLINVGSIDEAEYETLLEGIERHADGSVRAKLTMCTFQETYAHERYARFMGSNPENPRADYERRLTNFDRSFRAGLRVANPGVLLGLDPDLAFELLALAEHSLHLRRRGMDVYLSVPRLRQIAGGRSQGGVSDEDFVRFVSVLALGLPDCKLVLTTRESREIQHRLVPVVRVLSAGSAAVTPYTETGARFPLETSQFEVIDQRPFEEILSEHAPERIENFLPPA